MDSKLDFQQTFYVPIANHFFTLKIELINLQSDGWLREHFIEKVLASYEIRIPDLNKAPFQADGTVILPIPKFDYKKCGLTPSGVATKGEATLELKIVDMTRIDAMIVYNPNRNIMEDRPYTYDYSFKQANTVLTRAKLTIALWENVVMSDTFIFYFFYPRFSFVCWVLFQVFIYFFDVQYLLTYLVCGLILLTMNFSPYWEKNVTPVLR